MQQQKGDIFMKTNAKDSKIAKAMGPIVESVLDDYTKNRTIDNTKDLFDLPNRNAIIDIVKKMIRIIFPGYYRDKAYKSYNVNHNMALLLEDIAYNLNKEIARTLAREEWAKKMSEEELAEISEEKTIAFMKTIPKIREYIDTDIEATYDGDPAAHSMEEIILAYPGLFAITVNRIAHELFVLDIPLIPRVMTEYVHGETGIDIHPGATIGKYFFIDHGTGIVVGETTLIGEHVKIYQGVTLGALSTSGGQKLRNTRRHPTIEDYVTIYSGASILGGETIIGEHSVVGGNVFITKSIEPHTIISVKNQELNMKHRNPDGTFSNADTFGQNDKWFYVI